MGEIGMTYSQSSQYHLQKATSPARRGPVANEGLDRTVLGATIILRSTSLPARKETATNGDIKIRSRKSSQSQGRRKVLYMWHYVVRSMFSFPVGSFVPRNTNMGRDPTKCNSRPLQRQRAEESLDGRD